MILPTEYEHTGTPETTEEPTINIMSSVDVLATLIEGIRPSWTVCALKNSKPDEPPIVVLVHRGRKSLGVIYEADADVVKRLKEDHSAFRLARWPPEFESEIKIQTPLPGLPENYGGKWRLQRVTPATGGFVLFLEHNSGVAGVVYDFYPLKDKKVFLSEGEDLIWADHSRVVPYVDFEV